jgi:hypothetical protein
MNKAINITIALIAASVLFLVGTGHAQQLEEIFVDKIQADAEGNMGFRLTNGSMAPATVDIFVHQVVPLNFDLPEDWRQWKVATDQLKRHQAFKDENGGKAWTTPQLALWLNTCDGYLGKTMEMVRYFAAAGKNVYGVEIDGSPLTYQQALDYLDVGKWRWAESYDDNGVTRYRWARGDLSDYVTAGEPVSGGRETDPVVSKR